MASPPSIGDEARPELVLSRYEEPLPKARKEVVAAFESILNRGGVQKVIVEIGKPIQVTQFVDKSLGTPPADVLPDDLWGRIRNGSLDELDVKKGLDVGKIILYGFERLAEARTRPVAFFFHDQGKLIDWLKLPKIPTSGLLFGLDIIFHPEAPEDGSILVGMYPDESALGIRLPID